MTWEQFAKNQALDMRLYMPPKYKDKFTEHSWIAWEKGTKFRAMKEGRLHKEETRKETFFGNNIRDAIRELKAFFSR